MILDLLSLPGLGKGDHVILKFNFNCYTKTVLQLLRNITLTKETIMS